MALDKVTETYLGDQCYFITAKDIESHNLEEFMTPRIMNQHFPKNTRFYYVNNLDGDKSVDSMYHQVFSKLMKLRKSNVELWKEMKYELESRTLSCVTHEPAGEFLQKRFKSSQFLDKELEDLSEESNYNKPYAIILPLSKSCTHEVATNLKTYIKNVEKRSFEFLNLKAKTVVVFNKAIEPEHVKECIKHCVENDIWPENSKITILCGFHTSSHGTLGHTFYEFKGNIKRQITHLKGELKHKLDHFHFGYILLETVLTKDSDGRNRYKLQDGSIDELKYMFDNILDSEKPNVLIFASCFSKRSEINNVIDACGLYPALFLTAEMGLVTGRQRFKLNEKQRSILDKVTKVRKYI